MKSKVFFCLLLFVSVLCVSRCTASVGADDSNDMIWEIKTALKEEMAKYAETVGNKLEDYFKKLNESVTVAWHLIKRTERSVRRATDKLPLDRTQPTKHAKYMFSKVWEFVWAAGRYLHKLRQLNDEMLKYKKQKVKERMSECVEKNESINAVMKNATGNVGNENSAGANRGTEIYKKAVTCTELWGNNA